MTDQSAGPGATGTGEDSVRQPAESSRPQGLLPSKRMTAEEIAEMSEDCQCSCRELDRLQQHKDILLHLVREGMRVGSSVKAFVEWQQKAAFIIANERSPDETTTSQPVAWRTRTGLGDWYFTTVRPHPRHLAKWEPLYIANTVKAAACPCGRPNCPGACLASLNDNEQQPTSGKPV